MNETENQIRLRRAKEALAAARDRESIARRALADATESVKSAKERYEELFMAEEMAEADRIRAYSRQRENGFRHNVPALAQSGGEKASTKESNP